MLRVCLFFFMSAVTGHGAIAIFDIIGANGGAFDGSGVGGTLTSSTGESVILTTTAIAPSGTISINGSGMGINHADPGDAPSAFDDDNGAESWSFSFDTEIVSMTIDLNALSAAEGNVQ